MDNNLNIKETQENNMTWRITCGDTCHGSPYIELWVCEYKTIDEYTDEAISRFITFAHAYIGYDMGHNSPMFSTVDEKAIDERRHGRAITITLRNLMVQIANGFMGYSTCYPYVIGDWCAQIAKLSRIYGS